MNLGMLVGLGFGYILFDKKGQKLARTTIEKVQKAGSDIVKNIDKKEKEVEVIEDSESISK